MQEQLNKLIPECLKGVRQSQGKLYALLAPKMFSLCLRYSKTREEAEETLQEGFMQVFEHLRQYRGSGAFEGWVRKIMVNCALQKYRSRSHLHPVINLEEVSTEYSTTETAVDGLSTRELIKLVQALPAGYRMVFNLYVFEGFKHREIAELLGVTEGTSKSNLSDARAILQKAVIAQSKIPNNTGRHG